MLLFLCSEDDDEEDEEGEAEEEDELHSLFLDTFFLCPHHRCFSIFFEHCVLFQTSHFLSAKAKTCIRNILGLIVGEIR